MRPFSKQKSPSSSRRSFARSTPHARAAHPPSQISVRPLWKQPSPHTISVSSGIAVKSTSSMSMKLLPPNVSDRSSLTTTHNTGGPPRASFHVEAFWKAFSPKVSEISEVSRDMYSASPFEKQSRPSVTLSRYLQPTPHSARPHPPAISSPTPSIMAASSKVTDVTEHREIDSRVTPWKLCSGKSSASRSRTSTRQTPRVRPLWKTSVLRPGQAPSSGATSLMEQSTAQGGRRRALSNTSVLMDSGSASGSAREWNTWPENTTVCRDSMSLRLLRNSPSSSQLSSMR